MSSPACQTSTGVRERHSVSASRSCVTVAATAEEARTRACTAVCILNPFTLRVPSESIVFYSHTFEDNFGIKRKFTKYLNKSSCVDSEKHFSLKFFQKIAFVNNI